MSVATLANKNPAVEKYLTGLAGKDLLVVPTWEDWLQFAPPYEERPYETKEVTTRFNRNGYDWGVSNETPQSLSP